MTIISISYLLSIPFSILFEIPFINLLKLAYSKESCESEERAKDKPKKNSCIRFYQCVVCMNQEGY